MIKRKQEGRKSPESTKTKPSPSRASSPKFPVISRVVKTVPSKQVQQQSQSETKSMKNFLLNSQESNDLEGISLSALESSGNSPSPRKDKTTKSRSKSDDCKDLIGPSDRNEIEISQCSSQILTYSQIPFKQKESSNTQTLDPSQGKNFERKRISAQESVIKQPEKLTAIQEQNPVFQENQGNEELLKSEKLIAHVERLQSQNNQIIDLLSSINTGISKIVQLQQQKQESEQSQLIGKQFKEEFKNLIQEVIGIRSWSAPPQDTSISSTFQ